MARVRALEADGVPLASQELHQDVLLAVQDRVVAQVAIRQVKIMCLRTRAMPSTKKLF